METTTNPTGLPDESNLLAAERELAEGGNATAAVDRILTTPPKTMIGAAVKLRLLCDPDLGIKAPDAAMTALRQVLAIVERGAKDEASFQRFYSAWEAGRREKAAAERAQAAAEREQAEARRQRQIAAKQIFCNAGLATRLATALAEDGIPNVEVLLGLSPLELRWLPYVGPVGREAIEALRVRLRGGGTPRVVDEAAQ